MKRYNFLAGIMLMLAACGSPIISNNEKEIVTLDVPNEVYKLKVLYQPSDATIQSAIQVRKVYNAKKEEVLGTYERYNFVDTAYLNSDTTLLITIRDTVSRLGNKPNTIILKLK